MQMPSAGSVHGHLFLLQEFAAAWCVREQNTIGATSEHAGSCLTGIIRIMACLIQTLRTHANGQHCKVLTGAAAPETVHRLQESLATVNERLHLGLCTNTQLAHPQLKILKLFSGS